jgi:hypothetical protein
MNKIGSGSFGTVFEGDWFGWWFFDYEWLYLFGILLLIISALLANFS